MASLRQLAKLAGCGTTTVYRVLHNDPHVAPEMRQRVLELISQYRYRMDQSPLAISAVEMIGCVMPSLGSDYYGQVLQGIHDVAFNASMHLLYLHPGSIIQTCRALQTLLDLRVQGIILASTNWEPVPNDAMLAVRSQGTPLVQVEKGNTRFQADRVMPDEAQIGEVLVNHLFAQGHRRIAYYGVPLPDPRTQSVQRALHTRSILAHHVLYTLDTHSAEQVLTNIRTLPKPPTAIIAYNDDGAAEVIQAAAKLKIRVPEELSVVGCGNLHMSQFLVPALTTVEQQPYVIGTTAAELLLRRIEERKASKSASPVELIMLPPKLIPRASTAPPRW